MGFEISCSRDRRIWDLSQCFSFTCMSKMFRVQAGELGGRRRSNLMIFEF